MKSRAAPMASWLALLILGAADADALSLRSARAEAFLGDVSPGGVVALSSAARTPLGVENSGAEPAEVELVVESPPPERLKDGYDPLPDVGWVAARERRKTLAPGESWTPETTLRLPKGRGLAGGRYQFDLLYRGRGPGGGRLTVRTAVTLAAGEGPPPEPAATGELEGLVVSTPKYLSLKLANAGEADATVRLVPRPAPRDAVRIEEGWTPAPNPSWLKAPGPLKVPAGGVTRAAFAVEVPPQARYRGRKFAFTVSVEAEAGGRAGRTWRVLYVSTPEGEAER